RADDQKREGSAPEAEQRRAGAGGADGGPADGDADGPGEPIVPVAEDPGLVDPEEGAGEGGDEGVGGAGGRSRLGNGGGVDGDGGTGWPVVAEAGGEGAEGFLARGRSGGNRRGAARALGRR